MDKSTSFTGQPLLTQILKYLPRLSIRRIALRNKSDRYYKKLNSHYHLIVMLFSVFEKCNSLRELVTGMMAWQNRLQHLGFDFYPRRSTLSDANAKRSCEFFEQVYYELYQQHHSKFSPDSRGANDRLHIMDSSTFELFSDVMVGAGAFDRNGKRKGGVKAHMVISAKHLIPEICYFTEARENDRVLMEKVQLSPGAILVFDKGYVKHSQWQEWNNQSITWITRMISNAHYEIVQDMPVNAYQQKRGVISDQYILLGRGTNVSTEIIPARRIVYFDKKKNRDFVFLTNNERFQPSTIAAFYKKRWAIETKFKSLKQNFQLKYFLGDTANAIKIQLWCALIADLLIRIIMAVAQKRKWSYSNLRALIRMHLGTYVNLIAFLNSPENALKKIINQKTAQLSLALNSS
jgi:Transposase DDE domain/Domain of unknown function (DUF4372)